MSHIQNYYISQQIDHSHHFTINENINQHSHWNYTGSWTATIGWLQIPEFSKKQRKHSVTINWLRGIYKKEFIHFISICKLLTMYPFYQ